MNEAFKVNLFTVLLFLYCFRIGYIWTPYGHGMKFFLGPLLACLMLFLMILYHSFNSLRIKEKIEILAIAYFSTVAAFTFTIESFIAFKKDYFHFLYYKSGGYADKIFFTWMLIGIVLILLLVKAKHEKNKKYQELH